MSNNKFYISTAIPYVNAKPHIGFALELVQADVIARYHRIRGEEVFFLTGTDENALKNVQAAQQEGITTKELVDRNAEIFRSLLPTLNVGTDDFIRTTEERHRVGAQKLWLACQKDIYKKKYKGLYCVGCEEFKKEGDLENGLCPDHKKAPEIVEEENYFFKLSNYQKKLKELIEGDILKVVPERRKHEVLSFINQGLEDFSISRSVERAHEWGVPVPDDPSQIMYVWFDALSNYISALGYSSDDKRLVEWWQENPNKLHVIGKGILRFHAIYWPAMLLSAGISLPETVLVHGYVTVGGEKMSKSLGNVVDPFVLVAKYGTDAVRYFLLREITPFEDGDFTYEKFEERYNGDLASGLGNLVARVTTMAVKLNPKFEILNSKQIQNSKSKIQIAVADTWGRYSKLLEEFRFNEALAAVWELITVCDKYIEENKPWEEGRENREEVIGDLLQMLFGIAKMLDPFMPSTEEEIEKRLGVRGEREIVVGPPLFPRVEEK